MAAGACRFYDCIEPDGPGLPQAYKLSAVNIFEWL